MIINFLSSDLNDTDSISFYFIDDTWCWQIGMTKNLITFNSPAKVWNSQRRLRNFLIKGVIETKTSCFLLSRKNYTEITQIVEKLVEWYLGIVLTIWEDPEPLSGILFLQAYCKWFVELSVFWDRDRGFRVGPEKQPKGKAQESFGSISGFVGSMATEVWKTRFLYQKGFPINRKGILILVV